jgi:hypothetical protein
MVRRISPSQFRSKLRQLESKQRQAINRYNQQVRKYNSAVSRYNAAVRTYQQRMRADRNRLRAEIARMSSRSSVRYVSYQQSVSVLTASYRRLDAVAEEYELSPDENYLIDLSEREAANSVGVLNALEGDDGAQDEADESDLQSTVITDEIRTISADLDSRWRGALFALNPLNPEAARHFCTSVREIFGEILNQSAPDQLVMQEIVDFELTPQGAVTRRSKMAYLLGKKGIENDELASFASDNVDNIVELFKALNSGTHGASGSHDTHALRKIKRRVEDGLLFLCQIAA